MVLFSNEKLFKSELTSRGTEREMRSVFGQRLFFLSPAVHGTKSLRSSTNKNTCDASIACQALEGRATEGHTHIHPFLSYPFPLHILSHLFFFFLSFASFIYFLHASFSAPLQFWRFFSCSNEVECPLARLIALNKCGGPRSV